MLCPGSSRRFVYENTAGRKRTEMNLASLAEVSEDLALLMNIDETMNKIAAYFGVSACAFAELNEGAEIADINHGWHCSDVSNFIGPYRMQELVAPEILQLCRTGKALIVRDLFDDLGTDGELYAALNVGSFISVPLERNVLQAWATRLVAGLDHQRWAGPQWPQGYVARRAVGALGVTRRGPPSRAGGDARGRRGRRSRRSSPA